MSLETQPLTFAVADVYAVLDTRFRCEYEEVTDVIVHPEGVVTFTHAGERACIPLTHVGLIIDQTGNQEQGQA